MKLEIKLVHAINQKKRATLCAALRYLTKTQEIALYRFCVNLSVCALFMLSIYANANDVTKSNAKQ